MFEKATPESTGIRSENLLKYLKILEMNEISTHSVLIARGDKLILEAYWKPFERETGHRMYSQTKSYVAMAILLLADEGKLHLNDKIIDYFPDKLPGKVHPYLEAQTILDMLMMRTCFDEGAVNWFASGTDDRVKTYFSQEATVYPGTQYKYDSSGSFVMGALVERLTGMSFLDYLRQKFLNEIGFSKEAYCLIAPGGYAWADSALICTTMDMMLYCRLLGNHGVWNGKQLIKKEIIDFALNTLTDNFTEGIRDMEHCGYSCQFWHFYGNSFGFNGMHDQVTLYDPDTDICFSCTAGNYRSAPSRAMILSYLFSEVIMNAKKETLPENPEAYRALEAFAGELKLVTAHGEAASPVEKEIDGKVFVPNGNQMGISEFSLHFAEDEIEFRYLNEQGEKSIRFGRKENIFQQFPETGYSDLIGSKRSPGHTYSCAASAAWGTENQLSMKVQIIDVYIGNVNINFAYKNGHARVTMTGDAEDFLDKYKGYMNAVMK